MPLKKTAITLKCQKLLIKIKSYEPAFKDAVTRVFKSNQPLYFLDAELSEFHGFLDNPLLVKYYDVILYNDEVIGCGGIVPNENQTVSMTWGMVHQDYHKKGFGKFLLEHRLKKCHELFPGKTIIIRTTQHTWKFFERYKFKLMFTTKDYWGPGMDLYHMERD